MAAHPRLERDLEFAILLQRALRMIREGGRSVHGVARELGIPPVTLHRWHARIVLGRHVQRTPPRRPPAAAPPPQRAPRSGAPDSSITRCPRCSEVCYAVGNRLLDLAATTPPEAPRPVFIFTLHEHQFGTFAS